MIKDIYSKDGSKFLRSEEDTPMQGVDFCHFCGQDLYLFSGRPCPDSDTGHAWVQFGDNVINF